MTLPNKIHKFFHIQTPFQPSGDQPTAIKKLVDGCKQGKHEQVLLGVTGSGKTFTMAHVIQELQRPTLIMAPNKILAAQLYEEMKAFFPDNAVEYFVSYYDYYQPEAYVAKSDTYIEKTASVNEMIDRMRHSATRALMERTDVIIVASVSCIYGLGSVEAYTEMTMPVQVEQEISPDDILKRLVELQYTRNDIAFERGTFRRRGDVLDIFPSHSETRAWRITFFGDTVENIEEFDSLTGEHFGRLNTITIFANSHHVTPGPTLQQAIKNIKVELDHRLKELESEEKLLEAARLKQRVTFDLEMLVTTGHCAGIENYSRYLTNRGPGQPPPTLYEYLPKNALLLVDESHVAVPQIRGMYAGDQARKTVLSEYGFRLPSCLDNRPLKFEEWDSQRPTTVFVSATPGPFEMETCDHEWVEQVIRPTGLVDPICEINPCEYQLDHLLGECKNVIRDGGRILVTTLTKKMAESLTTYFNEMGVASRYMHSDVETLERIELIHALRQGVFDVLVGINLLREGLDIPECAMVAILDADKEGYLRSKTSLIQTIGRAARHVNGRVLLYADRMTKSMKEALDETERRRKKQMDYNEEHGIVPRSTSRTIAATPKQKEETEAKKTKTIKSVDASVTKMTIPQLEKAMKQAAQNLEFEKAAELRDRLIEMRSKI